MALAPAAALWLFLAAAPVALWVAWSDMRSMRIPNRAVVALVAVYALVGLAVLPLSDWAWGWTHLVVVLAVGFLLNMAGLIGAGDAKFAAAMAPFVPFADAGLFMLLFASVVIAAFVVHRGARATPAIRRATPDWASWTARDFPMGLALGGGLLCYLSLPLLIGAA